MPVTKTFCLSWQKYDINNFNYILFTIIIIISGETFCIQSQITVEKFPNFRQNLSAFVRGWQLVAVGVTSCDSSGSYDTSWRMTAGMSRPVSLFSQGLPCWILMASLIFLLDTFVLVFFAQYLGLFQAANVARIVQMFTHHCSRVSACCVFFVSCPQASARLPNVHFVTAVTFQLVYHPRLLSHGCFVLRFHEYLS